MAPSKALRETLVIRRVVIDDFADVRHVHATALSAQTADTLSDAEIAAFTAFVNSAAYGDLLLNEEIYGAWIGRDLVGTAAWQGGGDNGAMARICSVFVRPLFVRFGIGQLLLTEVEARARDCGYSRFGASATANAVPFFESMGYRVASRGTRNLSPGCALPVTFLRKTVLRVVRPSHQLVH
jgi:putative acetyltransferase